MPVQNPLITMAQILDPIPPEQPDNMLCCYVNATSKIQIARITNIPNWYFERVVFPGQRLMFEALSYAQLEIHTGMMASAILSDTIPCDRLCLAQDPEPLVEDIDVEPIPSTPINSAPTLHVPQPVSASIDVERIA